MRLIVAENIGFCKGVERSVKIAEASKGENVFCLHPLIHNTAVTDRLGIPVKAIEDVQPGDAIVVSAHGSSPDVYRRVEERGGKIVDATCPFVADIHKKVDDYSGRGYRVIIFGDEGHAEVKGIEGWCRNNFQTVTDAEKIDWDKSDKFVIVAQSTFSEGLLETSLKKISENKKISQKTLVFLKTICYTTVRRQKEIEKIVSDCSDVLVIGDKNSANTVRLTEYARSNGARAYLIENVSDLSSVHIENNKLALGIISGASTPKELIMEVISRMSEEKIIDSVEEVKTNTATEASVAPMTNEEAPQKVTMAEALKKYGPSPKTYREGMHLKVRVISADLSGISVAIEGAGKNDSGFISRNEAEIDGSYNPANYTCDMSLDTIIIPKDPQDKNKAINLSKKAYDELKADDEYVKRIIAGEEFTLDHTQEIKGGLLGKIGTYTIFIPASQIKESYVKNLSDFTNKTLRLKALPAREELDEEGNPKKPRNPKRIVASQRIILEAEKAAREEEFWSKIFVGAIVNGKVKRFADFGAFVNLKQKDGLVHNTDVSWSKRRDIKASEVLEINKSYDFIVLSIDKEHGKIGLGYKQLQKKPIEVAQEKYPVGTVVAGKVAKIMSYGIFVELEPGLDGLVHISQIQNGYLENIHDASVKEGDTVNVKVMNYEAERITLSIKETLPPPEVVAPVAPAEDDEGAKKDGKKDKKSNKKIVKEEEDEGPHNFVSGGSSVNLGAMFGDLKNLVDSDGTTDNN